jgi:SAM-dependent methyltransferase
MQNDRFEKIEKKLKLIEDHFGKAFWRAIDIAYESSLPHRSIKCIVCEKEGHRTDFEVLTDKCIFGGGVLERYRCPTCDCIFGPLKYLDADEDFVSRDYELLYTNYSESDSTENEIRTFGSLGPKSGALYLDWGCGGEWSKTIATLRAQGHDVWGYEPTIGATAGFVVKNRDEISAKFDGIFSNNVIEHFRNPIAQFKEFHSILKPDGVMAHSSPCYEYEYAFTRFHTLFLLGKSPHVLAERSGFKVSNVVKDGRYINHIFKKAG